MHSRIGIALSFALACTAASAAETRDLLKDGPLAAFRPVDGWRGVTAAKAVEGETALALEGEGSILVNTDQRGDKVPYLLTKEEFGDVRIELEFMVPKGSNSGVYVAGRYEVQILDSHGRERFGAGDLSVREGDFAAYKATCHEDAVLVTGTRKTSYPLRQALFRWKRDFDDAKAGMTRPTVDFRFSHRFGDATTAHEAGVFRYVSRSEGQPDQAEYIDFEALMIRQDGKWKMLMEYQKGAVSEAAWDALAEGGSR